MIKKILIVVDSINIEDSSGSKANVALINNLQEAGFEILVYHYTRKNISLKNVITFEIPEIKSSILYFLSRFQRVFSRHFKVNLAPFLEKRFGFSFTFFNDINSIRKAVMKQSFEPDLVLTLSKGASFRSHYAILKVPELHNKWMAYIHDPYPFHFYPRPYNWVEPNYARKELFFKELAQKAAYSAFPSQLLQEWMSSYFPEFSKTGIIIPHQNEKYEVQNENFPSYFDPEKFNLLHAGNLMKQRSPRGLIEGFKMFLEQNSEAKKDAKLLLLGNASYHTDMLEEYAKNSPEIYIYNGNKLFDEVYYLQKNVSINIILEAKGEISPFLPAKFPHCIEANKIILSLAPYYSETRRLLGNDYEYWSEVDNISRIASLIERLYQLWKQNPNNLDLNRKDLEEYVSVAHLKETINKLLN
ncbi:Glycosyltransferase involved in cell wall bisynthesis [Flavobacterium resistens]|uniref:Glycosyltransferase involved in cell wall bisynthesis n=1 Tax=Flavobacterium resistens TaxID=443612 RepID=A0A521ETG7_9FLAO|nr:glycosyltransferase family 4 protein [Flavobacterium resistens]MRX67900.1 UDP-glycosyltransferase [Flavobacterium resistens]SMO86380.1 Glycosyltransferase involved in cell wall bisynthesis [Flavobacterium resistens]